MATCLALLVTEEAEAVGAVFLRPVGAFELPDSVAILEWDGHTGRFVGMAPGYVADLYRVGAIAVLPVRSGGCVALRDGSGDNNPLR